MEGAGVHLKRVFGYHQVPMFDPFLLMDDFHSNNPAHYINGFPWHPHRGIETITYMLEGSVEHGDSLGNEGTIFSGDVQWMTAGSGIIHQEMPKGEQDGSMWGFQLWANLPKSNKMMTPRYRDIKDKDIPRITTENGTTVKVICGKFQGTTGPVEDIVIEPEYFDITIPPETEFNHMLNPEHTIFTYVIKGSGYFDQERDAYAHNIQGSNYFDFKRDCLIRPESLVLYEKGEGIKIHTQDELVRFLLISGKPLQEPVAWYGPIVMNTQEELRTAFEEYKEGTFIKHDQPEV